MTGYRLISADSHVSEPPNLWAEGVDKKYRDCAPRLAVDLPGKEGAYFLYEGYAPHPIGIGLGAGKSPEELKEFLTKATYADARPGGLGPGRAAKGQRTRRGRGRCSLHDARLSHLLAEGCRAAGRLFPRLQRLADAILQLCAEAHGRSGADFALRPEGRGARARALRQDGAQGRDDLVLAAAGAALQLRCLRPVLGRGAGTEDADQPARDHRHGGREPVELGRALYAHHRARLRGREILQRAYFLRRARPLPEAADRLGREQHRLDPLLPAADGSGRRALARRRRLHDEVEAERVFPAADVGDIHRRLCWVPSPPVYRCRSGDGVLGFPAPGLVLAAFAGGRRARLQGCEPRGGVQDHPRQRRPALRLRRVATTSAPPRAVIPAKAGIHPSASSG